MTWITDNTGTRWAEPVERKRRKTPRALRFADVKVGDQLMRKGYHGGMIYCVVTDLWFDPVQGESDPLKGSMVGYAQIDQRGELRRKSSTTIRGLASQQFTPSDRDYVAFCKARIEGMAAGVVVGIGRGRTIRQRPKIAGL